jgi:hypothetical protein
MNNDIKLSQLDLDSSRSKRTLAETTRKYEFLLTGLADVLKKLELMKSDINPSAITMKGKILEFIY